MGNIFFLGPLPPPMHGYSIIHAKMLRLLEAKALVRVSERKKFSWTGLFSSLVTWISFAWIIIFDNRPVLYMGMSGGSGQVIDCLYVIMARLRKVRIYVHHHSFSYINKPTAVSVFIMHLLRHEQHIVLCNCMRDQISAVYQITPERVRILSNAAFLPKPHRSHKTQKLNVFSIGFLGNITDEKGIFKFFEVLDATRRNGLLIEGVIGGPVDTEIRARFNKILSNTPSVRYLGPVYDSAKEQFFLSIDVLLFPTNYPNEAEPLTILESISFGVPVIATPKGCIDGLISSDCGLVVPFEAFVREATLEIGNMTSNIAYYARKSEAAVLRYDSLQSSNSEQLAILVSEICSQ